MKTVDFKLPVGYLAAGEHIGIKKAKKDLGLIVSESPMQVSGYLTKNVVKAAPVHWCRTVLDGFGTIKAVVVNSGNANACTGKQGELDCYTMAATVAELCEASPEQVIVCSTGVIGKELPIEIIERGINNTYKGLSHERAMDFAEAIMTTDTFAKHISVQLEICGKTVTISGATKGSGMIHPNMATLLAFVMTDVAITRSMLDRISQDIVDNSFNMISVDGDTSTNDSFFVMANGMAGNPTITEENEDSRRFAEALAFVCKKLAVDIATDGEGATKLMEVCVKGAGDNAAARTICRSVTASSLFKAALFGADANYGRVLCAMGYSGAEFSPERVDITFRSNAGEIQLMEQGTPIPIDEELAKRILTEKHIFVDITLYEGQGTATGWGCDLSYEYVRINGDYRS